MYREKREYNAAVVTVAFLLIAVFAASLFCALTMIGADGGGIKTAQSLPVGLVSAGAPRSQLALKQMFDSMSAVRSNGNKTIYEPITEEYLCAVEERIKSGESPMLSVEEVLYIISDTVGLVEKYDGVRLHGIGTLVFRRGDSSRPSHIAALENSQSIMQTVIYRIQRLCISAASKWEGDTFTYYPDSASRDSDKRRFVFSAVSDGNIGSNIVFYPGDGQRIDLFPSSELKDSCNTKYMSVEQVELTRLEREILAAGGYEYTKSRNVTPEYWTGLTECKLVVVAGRIIIIDPISGKAVDSAPENMRTLSIALGDGDGDRAYELYFTAYSQGKSLAVRYVPGGNGIEILFGGDFCMGAYEDLGGTGVSFYRTEQIESGSYLNLLRRVGDKIRE